MSARLPILDAALLAALADGRPLARDLVAGRSAVLAAHGLAPLAAARLEPDVPANDPDVAALRRARQALAASELATAAALSRLEPALVERGVQALIVKGEALARTHYPDPATRARGDVDLWLRAPDMDVVASILVEAGWRERVAAAGQWVQPERSFEPPAGGAFALDLHLRPFSQPVLAEAIDLDGVFSRAVPLGGAWRMPEPADALLVAALHLIAHHADAPRAVWLLDVARIARDADVLARAIARAERRGVHAILRETLLGASRMFPAVLPADRVPPPLGRRERSAALLAPMGARARWWFDLWSLPDLRARWTWVRETFVPPRAYLRARGVEPTAAAYLRRAWRGILRSKA